MSVKMTVFYRQAQTLSIPMRGYEARWLVGLWKNSIVIYPHEGL